MESVGGPAGTGPTGTGGSAVAFGHISCTAGPAPVCTVDAANSSNITSATGIADATDKGLICITTSVTVKNQQALFEIALSATNADLANGNTVTHLGGVQAQTAEANCPAGTTGWVRTYGPDGHRTSDARNVWVSYN